MILKKSIKKYIERGKLKPAVILVSLFTRRNAYPWQIASCAYTKSNNLTKTWGGGDKQT